MQPTFNYSSNQHPSSLSPNVQYQTSSTLTRPPVHFSSSGNDINNMHYQQQNNEDPINSISYRVSSPTALPRNPAFTTIKNDGDTNIRRVYYRNTGSPVNTNRTFINSQVKVMAPPSPRSIYRTQKIIDHQSSTPINQVSYQQPSYSPQRVQNITYQSPRQTQIINTQSYIQPVPLETSNVYRNMEYTTTEVQRPHFDKLYSNHDTTTFERKATVSNSHTIKEEQKQKKCNPILLGLLGLLALAGLVLGILFGLGILGSEGGSSNKIGGIEQAKSQGIVVDGATYSSSTITQQTTVLINDENQSQNGVVTEQTQQNGRISGGNANIQPIPVNPGTTSPTSTKEFVPIQVQPIAVPASSSSKIVSGTNLKNTASEQSSTNMVLVPNSQTTVEGSSSSGSQTANLQNKQIRPITYVQPTIEAASATGTETNSLERPITSPQIVN